MQFSYTNAVHKVQLIYGDDLCQTFHACNKSLLCICGCELGDGAGRYLYVNSTLQREGDVARIITQQEFPASTGVCHLRFWFHMYGSKQMGTLKVRKGMIVRDWQAEFI